MAGSFSTIPKAETELKLSDLNVTAHVSAPFSRNNQKSNYDVIFGRDLLHELGIQLDCQNKFKAQQDINIPMKPINCKMRTHFSIQDNKNIRNTTKIIKKILDANYKKTY